ncbi:MAG: hypothetical protein CL928_06695 [Deltaproteobacteria bacterium]|nr:hypothetical protein [Deltaproteobacteria bacterium]
MKNSTSTGNPVGKTALVCGGGGITGGVFEVGALRALDRCLGGGVVNSLDCYAGASAGSLVATLLASGLTPEDMDDVLVRGARNRKRLPPLKRTSIYGLDLGMWAASAGKLPWRMGKGFALSLLPGDSSRPTDALFEALGGMPSGLFTNEPLAKYVSEILEKLGLGQDFENFPRELLITAVNVDTGHRVVFGQQGLREIPISRAIQASAALPLLFKPVRLAGQDFVDGGIERNLPVDVAVQNGASLIIAVNPMVPVVNDPRGGDSMMSGHRYLSDRGLPAVLDQVLRMLVRSQVVYGLRAMRDQFPEVDIVLLEPEAHDWRMFSYHPMRYSVRQQLAQHAYDMTAERLLRESDSLTHIFERHGLDFQAQRLGFGKKRRAGVNAAKRVFHGLGKLPVLRKMAASDDEPDPFW